jgi:hypothetical protein
VIDVLRSHTPRLLSRRPLARQALNVLSRILLCRTATLRGRTYECPTCHSQCNVYNSCTDRHCPQCGGARRADWLDKTAELVLPKVAYFQVIFTLPDRLSGLILGNRRELYDLLFHAAWRSLDETLRSSGQFQPAAQLVLHTWNQRLAPSAHPCRCSASIVDLARAGRRSSNGTFTPIYSPVHHIYFPTSASNPIDEYG